jgi:hypothetical protein
MRRALALLFALTASVACAPKLIPGTEIRDSDDNRQILEVFSAYRTALEARSVDGIMKLVHPSFFDDSGTPDGSDDFDYKGLKGKLTNWVEKTQTVRANLQVKRIDVKANLATVKYFYDLNYEILGPDGAPTWKRDSDSKETTLRRVDGRWMIVRGL